MAAAVPEQLVRGGIVAVLLLLLCLSRQAAGTVVANCSGDWQIGRYGWGCYRLAPNYELYHKVVNDTLHLGLDVWPGNDTGLTQLDWIGIGISEAGGMPGADIAVLARNTSSPRGWDLWDMFARGFTRPDMDVQQEKTLLAVQERADGRVRARMSFPLTSCDQQQDRAVRPGIPSYLIYAFGQGEFDYHGTHNRGDATLLLANDTATAGAAATPAATTAATTAPTTAPAEAAAPAGSATAGPTPANTSAAGAAVSSPTPGSTPGSTPASTPGSGGDLRSMDLIMPAITIPTLDTDPYLCFDFELPGTQQQPFHLVEFDVVENTTRGPSQDRYIHHAVVYNCTSRPPTFGNGTYSCVGTVENCSTFVLVSATQGTTTYFPPAAGYRIGVGAMRYVVLQVHYNNVQRDPGLVDSSGFRIRYTPQLRPYDMGMLTVGMEYFDVPALSKSSTGPNICPPACTRRFRKPVTLVSNLLHMHQIGASMSVQHYRQYNASNASNQSIGSNNTGGDNTGGSNTGGNSTGGSVGTGVGSGGSGAGADAVAAAGPSAGAGSVAGGGAGTSADAGAGSIAGGGAGMGAGSEAGVGSNTTGGSGGPWVELEPTGVRKYFDFSFQPFMQVPRDTATLLPGDVLAVTCNFNNPYNHTVRFGHRSSDEMCFAFIMYFPLQDVDSCYEWPQLRQRGLSLCLGGGDADIEAQLKRYGSLPATQQQALIQEAIARSVLIPRDKSIVTSAVPFVPQLPSSCPRR